MTFTKREKVMGTPILKLIFDRRKRATNTKEGAIELRITYNRIQKHATTGVRVLPRQWRKGCIVNRLDAFELQHTLDVFVTHARKVVNDLMERGELDMDTVVAEITGRQKKEAQDNVPSKVLLLDYFRERAEIRMYGCSEGRRKHYAHFLEWFGEWGVMRTFADLNEANVLKMDKELHKRGLKPVSIWCNYHRFMKSFILDAMEDGLIEKDPYKGLRIQKDNSHGLEKYLTQEEFRRIEALQPPTQYLVHARDLFVFQTYTCLSYSDLVEFDATRMHEVNGRMMYAGQRCKTGHEFAFMLMKPALAILQRYGGKLPVMSNEKYNVYLKALAVMAGIGKPVSSHWARHTGATLLLNNGVSMDVVAKILGHASTRITREVYAKLLDDTVGNAMAKYERAISQKHG